MMAVTPLMPGIAPLLPGEAAGGDAAVFDAMLASLAPAIEAPAEIVQPQVAAGAAPIARVRAVAASEDRAEAGDAAPETSVDPFDDRQEAAEPVLVPAALAPAIVPVVVAAERPEPVAATAATMPRVADVAAPRVAARGVPAERGAASGEAPTVATRPARVASAKPKPGPADAGGQVPAIAIVTSPTRVVARDADVAVSSIPAAGGGESLAPIVSFVPTRLASAGSAMAGPTARAETGREALVPAAATGPAMPDSTFVHGDERAAPRAAGVPTARSADVPAPIMAEVPPAYVPAAFASSMRPFVARSAAARDAQGPAGIETVRRTTPIVDVRLARAADFRSASDVPAAANVVVAPAAEIAASSGTFAVPVRVVAGQDAPIVDEAAVPDVPLAGPSIVPERATAARAERPVRAMARGARSIDAPSRSVTDVAALSPVAIATVDAPRIDDGFPAALDVDAIFPRVADVPLTVAFVPRATAPAVADPVGRNDAPETPVAIAERPAERRDEVAVHAPDATVQSPPFPAIGMAAPDDVRATPAAAPGAEAATGEIVMRHHLDVAHDGVWLDRLARDIAAAADHDQRMRFQLNPERLGALHVEIARHAEGAAVRFTADSEAARALIADAQPRLVSEARAQGMRIAETQVDLSGPGGGSIAGQGGGFAQQHQPAQQQGGSGQRAAPPERPVPATRSMLAPAAERPARAERYA